MTIDASESKVLRDRAAREVITRDLDRNVMVLAGAGAGKTHALIERMVAEIRSGGCTVDRMAAITFTRKAAGEMRGRFFRRLRKMADGASSGAEAERIRAALDEIDRCFIGTIHAFCGRLLRERPIEAGLPPDFTEIDGREEAVLRREVWDRFVQARYAAGDARLDELEEHGIVPEDLYAFFGRRCEHADLPLKTTHTQRPDLTPFVEKFEAFLDRVVPCIPDDPEQRDGLMVSVRRAQHLIANHGIGTDRDAARLLALFDGSVGVTLKHWSTKEAARELRDEVLPELQATVIEPALRLWRECAYRLVTEFVDDAAAYYDGVRQEQGQLTFQDLLLRAAELLRRSPPIRSYFQRRYETILVDEFQDTDPIQACILFYLTGSDVTEPNWQRLIPRAGSLFLVGDDKQSIYRFRRADVEIFRFVANRITETGGEVVRLNTSFRSLGRLCRWISEAFPAIFSADSAPYQAPFEPLHEFRPVGIDSHCVRKISVPKMARNRKTDIAAFDAERIAAFIAAAMRGGTELNGGGEAGILNAEASAGDFLILTRTTGQLPVYARALEAIGVPFDIVGGGRLGDTTEVAAIVTMLEAIYSPENPVPFVAYLRGPLAGFSDDELYAYSVAGGDFVFGAPIPVTLSDRLRIRMEQAQQLLEGALEYVTTLPPAAALECILERCGYLALAAAHPDGSASSRAGNLLRLLSVVRRHETRGWSWGRIVEDLRELVDDRAYKIEQMTLESGRDDVVRVMNVHQAKGLQAPVVFLASPYDTSYEKNPTSHVSRSDDAPYLSIAVRKPKGEYHYEMVAQPEGWAEDQAEEMRFEAAEESRLLYVAATRARNLLVVSAYVEKPNSGPWAPLYRYLDDVPELSAYPSEPPVNEADSNPSYAELCADAAARIEQAKEESYSVKTVTGRRAGEELDDAVRAGRGRDYGVVVHRLFEEAARGVLPGEWKRYAASLVREAGLPDRLAYDAASALERFQASSLWQRLEEADEVYTEVPLGMHVAKGDRSNVLRGVIDLVYRDVNGWHIVDYKTDVAETLDDAEALRATYSPQLEAYRRYWSRLADAPVADTTLWLVHGPASEQQLDLF